MTTNIVSFYPAASKDANLKCYLLANLFDVAFEVTPSKTSATDTILTYPALSDGSTLVFGENAVCRYFSKGLTSDAEVSNLLDIEELQLSPLLKVLGTVGNTNSEDNLVSLEQILTSLESSSVLLGSDVASFSLFTTLVKALAVSTGDFPNLKAVVSKVESSKHFINANEKLNANSKPTAVKKDKVAKKEKGGNANSAPSAPVSFDDIVIPVLGEIDWASAGLISSLKIIFTAAVTAAYPQSVALGLDQAVISRCGNAAFGDFQCNNAMSLSKGLKNLEGYAGSVSPKDIADRISFALPVNPITSGTSSVPNGFINIKVSTTTITNNLALITQVGAQPPHMPIQRVLVDFSSPNIAKEMHVGHLRSTIIGDSVCRILEFCKQDVLRINHVGDWGTQFGMLITYLQEKFPDILENPPNISDLTLIYKESKKRFDADELFKETSRLNVVKLQSGDSACRAIWTLLCNISRKEFQVVYDALGVKLEEVGESFYNPMIPRTIEELQALGLVEDELGMLIIKLPHFTIPLMVRKSDGGYGYDSTDMAAISYRIRELKRDWVVYITDAGQAPHFHMCFDAARAANWVGDVRLDHIGFGVVCGDDGKRFKTRSSETVRLIDLLNAAKDKMKESLQARAEEGKSALAGQELEDAASIIGYGAVKYFDLKQHPSTNYIFSYERMLDTKGDTAVYLLFAYARLASILRKAKEEKKIDLEPLYATAQSLIVIDHPAERALAFELLQLGDVIKSVIAELLPNRLCEYLKELAVKFTDFVTKCHVLNAEGAEGTTISRLLLCVATKQVMAKCFALLGIDTLDRI